MPPGLGAVVDDLQMPDRLPTHRADPPPALAQLERDDHALLVELTSVTDAHPSRWSIRLNAVTTRMSLSFASRLTLNIQQLALKGGSASPELTQVPNGR